MPYFKRKQPRLPHYDYSAPGCYFITICTKDRKCILSRISVGVDVPYGWGIGGRVAGDVDPYGKDLPYSYKKGCPKAALLVEESLSFREKQAIRPSSPCRGS